MKNAIIFDMDGTILDTLDDLTDSTNIVLKKFNAPQRTKDEVRNFVGNGIKKLLERAIPGGNQNPNFEKAYSFLQETYSKNCLVKTKPYAGILDLMKTLKANGIKMGIVSNKPDAQVKELNRIFFSEYVDSTCAIGAQEGIKLKPQPDSVYKVLENLNVNKDQAFYAGDSDVDYQTSLNAGLDCISVLWGFRTEEQLASCGASNFAQVPDDILSYFSIESKTNSDSEEETDIFLKGQIAKELDFYRIRDEIANLSSTEEGKDFTLKREASSDSNKINEIKNISMEWEKILTTTRSNPIEYFPQVQKSFQALKVSGTQLSKEELFAIGKFCISSRKLKEIIKTSSENFTLPLLTKNAEAMADLSFVENEIFSVIDSYGEIRDLPALKEIRKNILNLQKQIESAIKKYTSDSSLNTVLQSNVPVYRSDRQLLAVKASNRSKISGIVHEVSSTGQTVYIEPDEVVKANNMLVEAEYKLISETKKILRELTSKISLYRNELEDNHKILIKLDSYAAGTKYKIQHSGVFASECGEGQTLKLLTVRHPLLGEKCVPLDIEYLEGKKILIITGPNTGGKTVTLKTIALSALLNQAGFPVLASDGTALPVFTKILADIGDEQSIDSSLSTFSAHMRKHSQMLENADENTLLLLDELASGTDPQEGGALAMAELDTFLEKKSWVIATTHHGILKNYGYTNPYCINASVDFDKNTLRPTYKLLMGVPGESHALEIAGESGIAQEVIDKAKNYLNTEQADVSTLIKGLTEKHSELDKLVEEQKEEKILLEEKKLKQQGKELKLKEKELELKTIEQKQSFAFLSESRKELENLIRKIREGEITREKTLGAKNFISSLQEKLSERDMLLESEKEKLEEEKEKHSGEVKIFENGIKLTSKNSKSKSNKKTKARLSNSKALEYATAIELPARKSNETKKIELKEGIEVLAGKEKRKGILGSKTKNNFYTVHFGSIKMNFKEEEIIPAEAPSNQSKINLSVEYANTEYKTEKPKFELRLLGMRCEQALKEVQKQLDLCAITGFKSFSIIHGKGDGILQQAVKDLLSNYPGIKDFHFARPEDGGSGKTYVELE